MTDQADAQCRLRGKLVLTCQNIGQNRPFTMLKCDIIFLFNYVPIWNCLFVNTEKNEVIGD
jgi:hypothetical protein